MFSRRHPILFSFLTFAAIAGSTMVVMTLLIVIGMGSAGISGLDSIGEKVGVVRIEGVIYSAEETVSAIKQFREDDDVKAILLRIDSPGGGVGPSQEIYREVRKTLPTKKVVVSMGSVAASGGYYIAAGAHEIMANPGTITGSLGVIMQYTDFSDLMEKLGLAPVVIKSGEYKDIGSPVRPMTDREREILEEFTAKIHEQFKRDIAEGRGMEMEKVSEIADGRIFTGEEAVELGLVDRLGNQEDAIERAGRLGGIEGDVHPVYLPKRETSLLDLLTESITKALSNRLTSQDLNANYLYRPGLGKR